MQSEPSTARSLKFPGAPTLLEAVPTWQLAALAVLSLWLYASTLYHLVGQWWHDPNFSYGFFVPLFSLFLVWENKDRLTRIPLRPSWFGLPLIAIAICLLVLGQMGAELFTARFSILLLLAGLILLFAGATLFRALILPWAFLFLMIPLPVILLNHITLPLQLFASRVAAFVLPLLGVPTFREGNVLHVPNMIPLQVAEACSGIRSLMALITLSIIYGYLLEKRAWVRWLLAVGSIPIAIAANNVRIVGTGLIGQYWDAEKAEGFYHLSWGWIIFVVALLMLYALHAIVRWILPDDEGGDA